MDVGCILEGALQNIALGCFATIFANPSIPGWCIIRRAKPYIRIVIVA